MVVKFPEQKLPEQFVQVLSLCHHISSPLRPPSASGKSPAEGKIN